MKRKIAGMKEIETAEVEIGDVVGEGSTSVVRSGFYRGERIALKQYNDATTLRKDVHILKQCQHDNIVNIHGVIIDGSETKVVMEFIPSNLSELIHEGARGGRNQDELNRASKLRILVGAGKGLRFLHSQGVVHSDIKPQNILVTSEMVAKISDFSGSQSMCITNSLLGRFHITLRYAAPELLRGNVRSTQESDCYSFGVVMWECSTHEVPWDGQDSVSQHGLRRVSKVECKFAEMRDLMSHCMNVNPQTRYSCEQIVGVLERLSEVRCTLMCVCVIIIFHVVCNDCCELICFR